MAADIVIRGGTVIDGSGAPGYRADVAVHGVTTVVAGNCGFSIAPVRPEHRELLVKTLMHVEDMSPDTLFAGVPWDSFETFPQYLDAVEGRGSVLNYACYIGHTALRMYV